MLQLPSRVTEIRVGVVRKQLGLSFLGERRDATENMTTGDIRIEGLDRSVCFIVFLIGICRLIDALNRLGTNSAITTRGEPSQHLVMQKYMTTLTKLDVLRLRLNADVIEGSDVFQFIVRGDLVNHNKLEDHAELVKLVYKLTGLPAGAVKDVIWISQFRQDSFLNFIAFLGGLTMWLRPNIRMVDNFGEGRVFVVGDAAHVHSPAGGQVSCSGCIVVYRC